ncbi:MAG: MBL fold metallo-hydrolase [Nitrospinaceae bacterium]|nr:MBL fold metallo-hydrolase [Nitrospinaceae bacterium]
MFFVSGLRCPKVLVNSILAAAVGMLSGCVSTPESHQHSAHNQAVVTAAAADFELDGYYESLPSLGKKGYFVEQLAPEVYFFSTGIYNNLFFVTPEGVVITDPIKGKGKLLKQAIREVTSQPVRFMIYSHSHLDHIGDAYLFAGEGVQIVAQVETGKALRKYKDRNRPVPHINFGTNYTLSIGGISIELIYPGEGHGKGNSIIYIPSRKVLMYVDVATPKSVPFKNFAYTIDIASHTRGIEKALKLDFDVYVAGHLHRTGTRQEMEEVLAYHYASKEASIKAIKNVSYLKLRAKTKTKDIENLFGEYLTEVAEQCYQILKPEWKHRLMGFEAFTRGNCDIWISYHRTHKAP